EMLTCLEPQEITEIMSVLPIDLERDVFEYLEPELQENIVIGSGRDRVRMLLAAMSSDDRAEFLDDLDMRVRNQLIPLLPKAVREELLEREKFEDDQVGSFMSTEFCVLGQHLTPDRALEEVRAQAPSKETIYYSYVLDPSGKLMGFVSLRDLIMAKVTETVGEIMKTDVVKVAVDTDQEEAARLIQEYDLLAIPVVDRENHLLGLITHDDAIDIMEAEVTEDIEQMAGITVGEEEPQEYLEKSVGSHFKGRVTWLAVLAACFLVVASIIAAFEETLRLYGIVIVAFLPLVLATGASVGGQTSAVVIRGLATGSLTPGSFGAVIWKELRVGLFLAIALGIVAFALVALYAEIMSDTAGTHEWAGVAITVALVAHVVAAALLGAFIPLLVARLGRSPEVFSHPALNAVSDCVAVIIYLVTVTAILSNG
ncbi:MAG: magnesium transporter, partial [Planctomycetota bacterium]